MRNKLIYLVFIGLLLSTQPATSQDAMEEILQDAATTENNRKESLVLYKYNDFALSLFPAAHPPTATTKTFSYFDDLFEFYIWESSGSIWVEVIPLGDEVFICGPSFVIYQDGIQYDTLKLERSDEISSCGDISSREVFLLTQWSFYGPDERADLSRPFTLIFNADDIETISFRGAPDLFPAPGSNSTGVIGPNFDISIPSIIFQSPFGDQSIWLELGFDGQDANGDLFWKLREAGFN